MWHWCEPSTEWDGDSGWNESWRCVCVQRCGLHHCFLPLITVWIQQEARVSHRTGGNMFGLNQRFFSSMCVCQWQCVAAHYLCQRWCWSNLSPWQGPIIPDYKSYLASGPDIWVTQLNPLHSDWTLLTVTICGDSAHHRSDDCDLSIVHISVLCNILWTQEDWFPFQGILWCLHSFYSYSLNFLFLQNKNFCMFCV